MKRIIIFTIVIIIVIIGWNFLIPHKELTPDRPISQNPLKTHTFGNEAENYSLIVPQGYTKDEYYNYQLNPQTIIAGTKFTIPASLASGTNLSADTYISVEYLRLGSSCTASLFFDGNHPSQNLTENSKKYSVASSTGAGAGNRYEEIVYAYPSPYSCVGIRYFIHYGVIQNYPEGSVREFDREALIELFDQIRDSLKLIS